MDHTIKTGPFIPPETGRLVVALAIATVIVAGVLSLPAGFSVRLVRDVDAGAYRLSVYIGRQQLEPAAKAEPRDAREIGIGAAPTPAPDAHAATHSRADVKDPRAPPQARLAAPDWHEMAKQSASEQVAAEFQQEVSRDRLWRETSSVMFKPAKQDNDIELLPLLPDVVFRPEIHVFGLGVTLGSCFFGIPLVGIPVEERTAGPTLIYCARRPD